MPNVKYLIEAKSDLRIPLYPLPSNRTIACGQVVVSNSGRVFAITKTGRVYASRFSKIGIDMSTNGREKEVRLADFPRDDIKALDRLCLLDADKVASAQRESFKARQAQFLRNEIAQCVETLLAADVKVHSTSAIEAYVEKESERVTKMGYDGRQGRK